MFFVFLLCRFSLFQTFLGGVGGLCVCVCARARVCVCVCFCVFVCLCVYVSDQVHFNFMSDFFLHCPSASLSLSLSPLSLFLTNGGISSWNHSLRGMVPTCAGLQVACMHQEGTIYDLIVAHIRNFIPVSNHYSPSLSLDFGKFGANGLGVKAMFQQIPVTCPGLKR